MAATAVVHDHFVLLVDKEDFETPPQWLTDNFNIIPGGTHAGGSSRNKLIVFKDGTYLELFNWIDKPAEFLDWADKKPGLIDFAVTTLAPVTAEQNFETVRHNLSRLTTGNLDLGVTYVEPLAGGRKRGDGTEVRWKNSRPVFRSTEHSPDPTYFPNTRIDVPFFCHDVTDRLVRVPFEDDEITTHPCGAIGVSSVEVLVPWSHLEAYLALYGALLDVDEPEQGVNQGSGQHVGRFRIGVPRPVDSEPAFVLVKTAESSGMQDERSRTDTTPSEEARQDQIALKERGIGIRGLTLRTARSASYGSTPQPLAKSGIGTTVRV